MPLEGIRLRQKYSNIAMKPRNVEDTNKNDYLAGILHKYVVSNCEPRGKKRKHGIVKSSFHCS